MKRLFGTPITEYLPALTLALVTAGYLATAYGYSAESRVVPVLVAWSLLVLLLLDLISRTRTRAGRAFVRWLNPAAAEAEATAPDRAIVKRQVAAVLWLAGFAAALVLIGMLNAVLLYMVASLRLRGRRSYPVSLAAGAGMALVVWLLFAVLLQLQLYPGLLFGGA